MGRLLRLLLRRVTGPTGADPPRRDHPCTRCGRVLTYHARPVARFGPETGWFCDACGPRGYDR